MRKYFFTGIICLVIVLTGIFVSSKSLAQSIPGVQQWFLNVAGNYLYPLKSNVAIRVPSLANKSCLGTDSNGTFGTGTCGSGSSATTTINGFSGPAFTFGTGTPDTNIGLLITGSGSTITFQPTFSGQLSVSRGGTGTNTLASLTVGTGLSISGGQNVLIGTSTSISLGANVVTTLATGTSGNIFNGSIGSNTLTLNLPFASTVNTGQLQASDFTNFNNKVSTTRAINTTAPITGGGDLSADRTIACPTCSTFAYGSSSYFTLWNVQPGANITITTTTNPTIAVVASPTFTNLTLTGTLGVTGTSTLATTTITNLTVTGTSTLSKLTVGGNPITGTNTGDVSLAGENYLTLSGQQITANAVNLGGSNVTGVLTMAKGGTGTSTLPTVQGQFLSYDGNNYRPTNFVAGSNITITTTTPGQVTITGSGVTGLTSLNGATGPALTLATGTAGNIFNLASSSNAFTLNLPFSSITNTGQLQAADWLTFNNKISGAGTANQIAVYSAPTTTQSFSSFTFTSAAGLTNTATSTLATTTVTNLTVAQAPTFTALGTCTNGLITSSSVLTCNASPFLTGNQTITLSGAVTGSGATSIVTSFAVGAFATGTTGNIFNIATTSNSLTINLPTASIVNTGQLASADWLNFNNKLSGSLASGQVVYATGASTTASSGNFLWNNAGSTLTVTGSTTISNLLTVGGTLGVTGTSTLATTTINGTLTVTNLGNCNGSQFAQYTAGVFGCGTPSGSSSGGLSSTTPFTNGFVPYATSTGALTDSLLRNNGIVMGINATSSTTGFLIQEAGGLDPFRVSSTTSADYFTVKSTGLVGVGSSSPIATLSVQGTSTLPTTDLFDVASSTGQQAFSISATGITTITGLSGITSGLVLKTSAGTTVATLTPNGTNSQYVFKTTGNNNTGNDTMFQVGGSGNYNPTSGTNNMFLLGSSLFLPSSGTAVFNTEQINMTINQIGNSTGISRGLYINPTLTTAYDWRSLETSAYTDNLASPYASTTQYNVLLNAQSYASSSVANVTATITNASVLTITGAPIATASTTITSSTALSILGGSAATTPGTTTNAIGLYVQAPTGGINNYVALFMGGNVGIGTSTPTNTFIIQGSAAINPFVVASSTGTAMFTVAANGSTTLSSLGTGCLAANSGALYIGALNCNGTPAGSAGQIQFNAGGLFGAGNYFTIATSSGIATLTLGDTSVFPDSVLKLSHQGSVSNGFISIVDPVAVGSASYTLTLPSVAGTFALGTGAANQIGFWSGTNTLTGNSSYLWDNTAKSLIINSSTPTSATFLVVASSSAQTIPILTVASTSGASFLSVTAGGNLQLGTTTASGVLITDSNNFVGSTGVLDAGGAFGISLPFKFVNATSAPTANVYTDVYTVPTGKCGMVLGTQSFNASSTATMTTFFYWKVSGLLYKVGSISNSSRGSLSTNNMTAILNAGESVTASTTGFTNISLQIKEYQTTCGNVPYKTARLLNPTLNATTTLLSAPAGKTELVLNQNWLNNGTSNQFFVSNDTNQTMIPIWYNSSSSFITNVQANAAVGAVGVLTTLAQTLNSGDSILIGLTDAGTGTTTVWTNYIEK